MLAVQAHVESHIGAVTWIIHEVVSEGIHLDILVVEPAEKRPYFTLLTMGMSALPMSIPKALNLSPYTELMLYLPRQWIFYEPAPGAPGTGAEGITPPESKNKTQNMATPEPDPADERNFWPIRWLKMLARLPSTSDTWLGYGHSIPAGGSVAANTALSGFVLSPPLEGEEFFTLSLNNGKKIHFWNLVPVYQEEMDYKLKNGADALFELFDRYQVSPIIDISRPNVITCNLNPEHSEFPATGNENSYECTRRN